MRVKVKVKADILITIEEPILNTPIEAVILQAEQALNRVGVIEMPESKLKVGIRVHIRGKED